MAEQVVPDSSIRDETVGVVLSYRLRIETVLGNVHNLNLEAHGESKRTVLEYGFYSGTVVFAIFWNINIRDKAQCRGIFLELLQLVLRPRRSKRSNSVLYAQLVKAQNIRSTLHHIEQFLLGRLYVGDVNAEYRVLLVIENRCGRIEILGNIVLAG